MTQPTRPSTFQEVRLEVGHDLAAARSILVPSLCTALFSLPLPSAFAAWRHLARVTVPNCGNNARTDVLHDLEHVRLLPVRLAGNLPLPEEISHLLLFPNSPNET